jgi:hypothetical protein
MNSTHIFNNARGALVAAVLITALGIASFFAFEPSMGWAQSNPHDFVVSQTITNEVSFLVEAADVTMVGSIAGLTGGYATGTTRTSVNTNNTTGYSMTLVFASSTAMWSSTNNRSINNYTPAVTSPETPDYGWVDNSAGGAGEFGYTVRASTTNEVAAAFQNNGSTLCNTGSTETDNRCWLNPSTTPRIIINSSAPNGSSTTTLKFKVAVPNNPSPAIPSGIYSATGTLTATTNP